MNRLILLATLLLYSNLSMGDRLYGVSTHFAQNKTNPALLSKILDSNALNSIRDEIYWHDVEKKKGEFELSGKAKQSVDMLNMASKNGMTPLVVLDYGNPNYDGGDQPYSDEGIEAFGRYCQWVVRQLSEDVRYFEVWNEWNHGMGTLPPRKSGSARDYVKLTKTCAQQIRTIRPTAVIIGGAVTNDWGDWPWLTEALNVGLAQHVDGISVHLYSFLISDPKKQETFLQDRLIRLKSILDKIQRIDIYITEIGWPNHVGPGGTSAIQANTHIKRFILDSLSFPEIKGIWFYELKDSGTLKSEKEHNFGLLDYGGKPKTAYCGLTSLLNSIRHKNASKRYALNHATAVTFSSIENKTHATAVWTNDWPNSSTEFYMELNSDEPFTIEKSDCQGEQEAKQANSKIFINENPIILKHTKPLSINVVKRIKNQN